MAGPLPQSYQPLPILVQVEHVEEGSISIPSTGKSQAGYTHYQVVFKVGAHGVVLYQVADRKAQQTKAPTPQGYLATVECNVWKRFSDFQHLEKNLEIIHADSGVPVKFPSLVKAKYFGRFKDSVIEERRQSAEALLHFAVHSQHLRHSPPLLDFLKSATLPLQSLQMAEPELPPNYVESESGNYRQLLSDSADVADGTISQEELALLMEDGVLSAQTTGNGPGDPTLQGTVQYLVRETPTNGHRSAASGSGPIMEGGASLRKGDGRSTEELDELGLTEWTRDTGGVVTGVPPPFAQHSLAMGGSQDSLFGKAKQIAPVSSQPAPWVPSQPAPGVPFQPAPEVLPQPAPGVPSQPALVVVEATDWWSQALAATQEITDDFDALVEESEHKPLEVTVGGTPNSIPGTPDGTPGGTPQPPPIKTVASDVGGSSSGPIISGHTPEQPSSVVSIPVNLTANSLVADVQSPIASRASSSESIGLLGERPCPSDSNSRSPSPPMREANPRLKDKNAYVLQASKLIGRALQYEQQQEYQEAFDLLNAGIDLLLNGVQTDTNKKRRETVRMRTAQYLQHTEELHQKYLGPKTPTLAKVPSVPNVQTSVVPHHLKDFHIVNTIGKIMVVESRHTHQTYVIKVVHRTSPSAIRGISMKSRMTVPCPHMVNLLHQYDSANRSFLLLEHIKGGKLIDFVSAKRRQWTSGEPKDLRELFPTGMERHIVPISLGEHATPTATPTNAEEQLLDELRTLSPPKGTPGEPTVSPSPPRSTPGEPTISPSPPKSTLGEPTVPLRCSPAPEGATSDDHPENSEFIEREGEGSPSHEEREGSLGAGPTDSVDKLSELRQQLESLSEGVNSEVGGASEEGVASKVGGAFDTIISIVPPTPTAVDESSSSFGLEEGITVGMGLKAKAPSSSSLPFSPASLRSSPDRGVVEEGVLQLENHVKVWMAQVVLALEHLHAYGIVCRDLNPNNLLLATSDSVKLTYFGSWEGVDFQENFVWRDRLYMAPELSGCQEATSAADWWSLGAILFELLTGQTLISCHPNGVHSHLPLHLPISLTSEATSLLHQLLQVVPSERIGAGSSGVEELKAHPFFSSIDWTNT